MVKDPLATKTQRRTKDCIELKACIARGVAYAQTLPAK